MTSKTDIITDDYKEKYGFSDPVEAYAVKGIKGLNERVVQEIVRLHDEPAWMEQIRMKALRHFLDKEPPSWAPELGQIDYQSFYYYANPTKKAADSWDQLPEYIKRTYDKLGITEAEKKFLSGVGAVFESEAVYHSLQAELAKQGVVFTDTVTALKEYPDIMKKYFGTVVPYQDNFIAALQTAVWSAGSFVYVPEGVRVKAPLQAYFRINEERMGQFERTLIISEPFSETTYYEGCSAPVYSSQSLHSAIVEIIAKKGSFVKYTTLQNWSKDVYNLVTKRAHAYEDATVSWVDYNGGCLVRGTDVLTNNDVKQIEDVEIGSRVYSLNGEMQFVSSEVIAKRENPSSEVYKLTTLNRREIEATPNHPFLSLRRNNGLISMAWTPLSALKVGDLVAVSGETPDRGEPRKIEFTHSSRLKKKMHVPAQTTDDLLWLLGFYVGDGTSDRARVSFCLTESDPPYGRLISVIKSLFGLNGKQHTSNNVMFRVSSKDFADFIKALGFAGSARTKRVPAWVFRLPNSQKKAFVEGYVAADGRVRTGRRNVSVSSTSLALIKQVKALAISAGLSPLKISKWTQHAKFPNGAEGTYTNYYLHFWDRKVPGPLYFVPLTKIEPVGRKITYDIEVAGTGNFVANGMIVHNSRLTRKYPSVYLLGPRAKADIISVAYAGPGQIQDTGGKAIHLAKDTTSKIISRSVSKGGGHTAYRGLLHIAKGAKNVKSTVRCVKPDTMILGDNKPIAGYGVGSHAIGIHGENSVTRTYVNKFEGDMIRIRGVGLFPIEVTPDHPMLISRSRVVYPRVNRDGKHSYTERIAVGKPEWRLASQLKAKHSSRNGDYLLIPRLAGNLETRTLDVSSFAKNSVGLHVMQRKSHATIIPLDADLAWALGLYTAEGYYSQDKMKFALDLAEIELVEKLASFFQRSGYRVKTYEHKGENGVEVVVFATVLGRAFASWCGEGAPSKRIPDFVLLHRDPRIVDAFLDGYIRGDGARTKNRVGRRNITHIVTTSKLLAMQTQLMGARKGLFFRITKASKADVVQGRKVKTHEKYDVRCSINANIQPRVDDQFFYVPIRGIRKVHYRGPVHNLETTDHTYLISNAVSHNCDALLLDQQSTTATYPYMEIQEDDATVTHEASVGKVGEEQLFYLMSRGISEGDALSMVVNGFMEPFAKELPMTYAVEFNRLMSLEMTNAVG